MKIWVLWHEYPGEGGGHIERVYLTEVRAKSDLALLTEGDSCKYSTGWKLDELEATE